MPYCKRHRQCIKTAVEQARAACEAQGARFTPLRKRVLELVWSSHKPAKAYDVLSSLQKEDPSAKPPTVYRALDFLLEHGFVHKLHRLNAYRGCEHPNAKEPCFFLICRQCGTVAEDGDPSLRKLVAHAAKKNNFTPMHTTFEVDGLCGNCG